jgi:hypothetical protein
MSMSLNWERRSGDGLRGTHRQIAVARHYSIVVRSAHIPLLSICFALVMTT